MIPWSAYPKNGGAPPGYAVVIVGCPRRIWVHATWSALLISLLFRSRLFIVAFHRVRKDMSGDTGDTSPAGSAKASEIELSDLRPEVLAPSESTITFASPESQAKEGLITHDESTEAQTKGTGSIGRTCFNFVNTIIGSGVIGLPFALNEAGMPLGLIELVLFAVMTDYSVNILIRTGKFVGSDDYQDVCRKGFGRVRDPAASVHPLVLILFVRLATSLPLSF